jgi:hypothetical protein
MTFAELHKTLLDLCPAREEVPLLGSERLRLSTLRRVVLHLHRLPRAPAAEVDEALLAQAAALRGQAGAVLSELGQNAADELAAAIERAIVKWEQAGDLQLLPEGGRQAALRLHRACSEALDLLQAAAVRTPGHVALLLACAEATAAVDAACSVLRAVELRFPVLLRARLRAAQPLSERAALLPGGRPFFDLGQALLSLSATLLPDHAA